jgi:hypothetical protein
MKRVFIFLIDIYQAAISQFMGHCCRFHPTCSEYSKEVIQKQGAWKGGLKAIYRILRCNPFCKGGYDPS